MATAELRAPESASTFNYWEAFSRNIGILTEDEQARLQNSRVAIAGLGGVGGVHLITLARLGIGKFTIADPDCFELANFNRQYGAQCCSVGRSKAEIMAATVRQINPEAEITVLDEKISAANVEQFLAGADVLVDGIDFFAIDARRLTFQQARKQGIWGVTAGPHAFGTGWLLFDPHGMSFERYFDLRDGMTDDEKLVAFSVGCVPTPLHLKYLDLTRYFKPGQGKGASLGLACQLASGVVGAEVAKIVLGRGPLRAAPHYFQFDPHCLRFKHGYLLFGNRHPWQRLKRRWLLKITRKQRHASSV